jgi:hypothetical protein
MKTTIEMHGYEIVIDEPKEGLLTVSALKDGEVIEEFELEGGEDHPGFEGQEEEDFDELEAGEGQEEDEEDEEEDLESGEEEEEGKLESFNSFIRKRK